MGQTDQRNDPIALYEQTITMPKLAYLTRWKQGRYVQIQRILLKADMTIL